MGYKNNSDLMLQPRRTYMKILCEATPWHEEQRMRDPGKTKAEESLRASVGFAGRVTMMC
jgi:hypothetical protein